MAYDSSGPRSGKHAFVSGLSQITGWTLNWNESYETKYHSASRGAPERTRGVEDWNGTITGFGGNPGLFPGDEFAFRFFDGPDDGVYGHTGLIWYGNGIIDSMSIVWNWTPNQSLNWTINFSANGCLDDMIGELYDTSTECANRMCNLAIEYDEACLSLGTGTGTGTGSYLEWPNVESATWTVTANNQVITNSSTQCCTERTAGTLDWTLDIVDQEQYLILDRSTPYAFKLYTTSTAYWLLKWGYLLNVSNIRADISTGAIMTKTNNFAMTGRVCCGTDSAITGVITDPDSTDVWPVAAV